MLEARIVWPPSVHGRKVVAVIEQHFDNQSVRLLLTTVDRENATT